MAEGQYEPVPHHLVLRRGELPEGDHPRVALPLVVGAPSEPFPVLLPVGPELFASEDVLRDPGRHRQEPGVRVVLSGELLAVLVGLEERHLHHVLGERVIPRAVPPHRGEQPVIVGEEVRVEVEGGGLCLRRG